MASGVVGERQPLCGRDDRGDERLHLGGGVVDVSDVSPTSRARRA